MKRDHSETETRNDLQWKMDQSCENDHRKANYKYHLNKQEKLGIQIEEGTQSDHSKLQHDKPKASSDQEA